jgi:AraC-like DNA-binding protein
LFNGPLIALLRDLNESDDWRALCGPKSKRLKDQELILRFFAFRANGDSYKAPMKEFLNEYIGWNRTLQHQSAKDLTKAFESTISTIRQEFGDSAFRLVRAVNAAVLDSIMAVVAEGIASDTLRDKKSLQRAYSKLKDDAEYIGAVERATAREEQVATRLNRARHYLLSP